ncbi:Cys-tRNA(Pro) deacylase [Salinisphaera sp. Q1T1-3]|uniref:Cys-tRNA(Pro) deacylase n=1 Tax=Salinisphaera sp. Q1T1-3 TaxID=2321229 RepID=UPI000E770D68|nr:Cys-tRNA(Pro) deacylase [Salinisphaera sp. Q1T1-3]RJS91945.1 Cys-tRNA(Pro) deacylase [Salinisphaera sp. Q1T1-3]
MTPAIRLLASRGIAHDVMRYEATPSDDEYGVAAARALGLPPDRVFKTLVATTDRGDYVVGLVPVDTRLDLKKLAPAVGAKKASMAEPSAVSRVTGYVLGGVSPLGQKKRLATIIDASARDLTRMHISGGRRGLEIALAPADLVALTDARFNEIALRD